MAFTKKTPFQKLESKITNLVASDSRFKSKSRKFRFANEVLFEFDVNRISYGNTRCYTTKVEPLSYEDFKVTIPLSDDNIGLLSSNIANPPKYCRVAIEFFRKALDRPFDYITIGAADNVLEGRGIQITRALYKIISDIYREEGKDRNVRFNERMVPFVRQYFNLIPKVSAVERNYDILLQELIASGTLNQEDIIAISQKLPAGNSSDVIIKQQVHKQVSWLIDSIEEILDAKKLTRQLAKNLGNKLFGFLKSDIKGPEHLMEMIFTKYGQYTIFGVPVLLNTDKYVVNMVGLPRSQFDIILINHLSDLEVVELKRSDIHILEYDEGRNKFYASKELSVAVAQAERYISAVYRDNDEEYKIDNLRIRDYINREIGGTMTVDIIRPSALIVMSSYQTLVTEYDQLSTKIKKKVSKQEYSKNYLQAYKELKNSYRSISVTTYSELIENARTRMIINQRENEDEINHDDNNP